MDRSITPAPSQFASIAVSSSIVHVVYTDFRFGEATPLIYYTRSLDDGLNWETEVPLAESFASWYPSVAVAGSHVYAIWPDNRHGDAAEIYYKGSLDDGTNWGPEVRLTDNPGESKEPSVAVAGDYVHAAWYDDRDQNWEMYYKRGAMGNAGAGEGEDPAAATTRFLSAGPSPSTGPVVIRYDLPSAASVALEIFDASGVLVRRFMQEWQPSGAHEIRWNGRDGAGRAVPSGVYMSRIEMDGGVMKGRVVLTR